MEDLDDLDRTLFASTFKATETKTSLTNETKRKVMFKDFDDTDSLKNLHFSYEDDEDFQESLNENVVKDNKIVNLFGIKSEDQFEIKDTALEKTTEVDNTAVNKSPIKILLEKQQTAYPEKIKTSANIQAKKSSLMEDLFGNRSKPSPSADINKRKNTLTFETPLTRSTPGGESSIGLNESSAKSLSSTGFSLSAPKEPRRGRRASTMVQNDPLGLLLGSNLQIEETPKIEEKQSQSATIESTLKSSPTEDLPEWLGGPKVTKELKQESETTIQNEIPSTVKSVEIAGKMTPSVDLSTNKSRIDNTNDSALASKLLSMEFDQQTAIINMQQQENELRTAAVLSQQSEKLNYLLEAQKVKLMEQDKQFNMLIARQLERQTLLEAQIKSQQDRIDSYIQTLSAQPTAVPDMHHAINKTAKHNVSESLEEKVESENLLQKVQLEKLYLENTLESLKEKHEREIYILEESYKKQITFLEEAMVQMEKRMQDDAECLEADYKLKIQKLKDEISENEKIFKSEKETLKEENVNLIKEIRERHLQTLEMMQQENIETIKRITTSKESERAAIEIMTLDGTNVQNILNKSNTIIEALDCLQKKFESKHDNFVESQDNHLLIQEKNIEYLKELLEKQKDTFTEEKQKLMLTVQKLELEITGLTKEFQKQTALFKESEEGLRSREQALIKDREIFVQQTNWERERLQAMRDAWTKEEDRQLELLAQERQALATERGKLQIFSRLKIGVDESSKVELEATIRAAQEAAASANQERLKWQEKLNELELQKTTFQEKENRLLQKAKELQEFTQSAITIREEGLQALKEAHFIEERYKEKLNQLSRQQEILTQRESKLAAEKLELARERLTFRVGDLEKPEKDTGNNSERFIIEDPSHLEFSTSNQFTTYSKDIVDPQLVLLKWDLDNKLDIPNSFSFTNSH